MNSDTNHDSRATICDMRNTSILVWLPSPMGDAVLCTPALRAIRRHFKSARISFFAKPVVREILSPSSFNDIWLQQQNSNPFSIAKMLKGYEFTHAILFKNSFASGLATFLARIPLRIGYTREGRGVLLTDKLYPPKLPDGKFKPVSMIDYYLAIASRLGANTTDRNLQLLIDPQDHKKLKAKLPQVLNPVRNSTKGCGYGEKGKISNGVNHDRPIVVFVPGGAFGPSKCWLSIRFAQTADWLISKYNATVVVSVSSATVERQIAEEICDSSRHRLINLAERPVSLGELKSLFSMAGLVITNDTGPRHIAIALQRKVISLFGPNDPVWTDTGYENEIQLIGDVPCAPCGRPRCERKEHLCMQAISVEMVCEAAKKLLEGSRSRGSNEPRASSIEPRVLGIEHRVSFFIDPDYKTAFSELGLTSIDSVFSFNAGKNLAKDNLPRHRRRLQFEINSPPTTLFLKRYDSPPISVQLKNWLMHRSRRGCGFFDFESANKLASVGINTPKTISYGEKWGAFFEERSFVITEKIPNAESLERKLPDCFNAPATVENLKLRRNFIAQLAAFVKKIHDTNYRHRDLYFSHIFYSDSGEFYLIDLARAFKPRLFAERFRIKDIAQVYYSAPGRYFSKTDRMRFYLGYTGRSKLSAGDKVFIGKVMNKAKRMARHDIKHDRFVPFTD